MVYNRDELLRQAIEIIQSDVDVLFVDDVVSNLPCSRACFYDYFPGDSTELETIRKELAKNRVVKKKKLRQNWGDPNAAWVLQIALYKLICSDEEFSRLTTQKTQDPATLQPISINIIEQGGNESIDD